MRQQRIKVTVGPSMAIALELLAERENSTIAAAARTVLRAGLDRTIHSAECQRRIAEAEAHQTRAEWIDAQAEAAEELRECNQAATTPDVS